ncbi:Zn(II)2Cys6 transcription factor [Aspergillus clavatus NRRL 1]|uniref:C6 zinc finger domain protein n=1 Tax=Aspergillus clavatus (strain ATCC 1007 / CBS 513.65 / DSM 816 / NCTC 3887 / NRRL 1 / QM 1276 / 107) TaxID=344612 RepID=A1CLS8_ASPCL|nr:C6 zinc finger domain protein [Aspergillus clavatus NRRL 1]EAW09057.1 C6 zinc finger domain protein [Aspergillus clavatus NRRL 1]
MSERSESHQPSGWRIPKACQECRKRKIKCNGINPCKTCQLRNTPCVYRDVVRQRKKKHHDRHDASIVEDHVLQDATHSDHGGRQSSPVRPQSGGHRNQSASYTFNNSVSATHMASPSCQVQLYYGPTSHFTLMHEMYRGLVSNWAARPKEPQGEVEEAGAGLDMFSFRSIFFGTPAETCATSPISGASAASLMFLPYELARLFLQRFLSSLYALVPFQPKQSYEQQLDQLYSSSFNAGSDTCAHYILLMILATGALGTRHYRWGDLLFERVKAASSSLDDVVNLETVHTPITRPSKVDRIPLFFTWERRQEKPSLLGCIKSRPLKEKGIRKELKEGV